MTQPNLTTTFDTSLIDLGPNDSRSKSSSNINTSFSTTESDTISDSMPEALESLANTPMPPKFAGFVKSVISSTAEKTNSEEGSARTSQGGKQNQQAATKPTPAHHLPTQETYEQWAATYDKDGNILQAIDDAELERLLPTFLSRLVAPKPTFLADAPTDSSIDIIDLGCGTGRTTQKLLTYSWPHTTRVQIRGLDFSAAMLDIAASKLLETHSRLPDPQARNVTFKLHDCDAFSAEGPMVPGSMVPLTSVDAVVSTLVLEHIPLETYFRTVSALLRPGGRVLVTNMHSEMGAVSQAGFVNEEGLKIRGRSFAHTIEEMVGVAGKYGFVVEGEVKERRVRERDVELGVVGERGRKWIGLNVWSGMEFQKVG